MTTFLKKLNTQHQYNNKSERSLVVDKEILFSLVIHDPSTPPRLLWDSWAEEGKNQLQPEKGRAYLFSASQLPWKTISQLKLRQRIETSISNYLSYERTMTRSQ